MSRYLLMLVLLLPAMASAHRFAPSLLSLDELPANEWSVTWKTPIQRVSDIPLVPRMPQHCELQGQSPFVPEGTGKLQQSRYRCSAALIGSSISIEGLAANQSSALLTINAREGVSYQAVLTGEEPAFEVPEQPDRLTVMGRYTVLGAEHIWGGIDHLLFVLGLLLLVGGGGRLIATITAFTVGHSITLAMVTLGLFEYPVALVEFLIAFSIFVLAIELTRPSGQSRLWRWPWALAGVFGLLHGMGFAGALAETGLPQSNIPLALLFFNIGIELGQILFIVVLLLLGRWISRFPLSSHPVVPQLPVLLLGVLSALWCFERGAGVFY